jgi:hypothetical protein
MWVCWVFRWWTVVKLHFITTRSPHNLLEILSLETSIILIRFESPSSEKEFHHGSITAISRLYHGTITAVSRSILQPNIFLQHEFLLPIAHPAGFLPNLANIYTVYHMFTCANKSRTCHRRDMSTRRTKRTRCFLGTRLADLAARGGSLLVRGNRVNATITGRMSDLAPASPQGANVAYTRSLRVLPYFLRLTGRN